MKIRFDPNLSPALVTKLVVEYPDSSHVRDVNLGSAPGDQIWEYAKTGLQPTVRGVTMVARRG